MHGDIGGRMTHPVEKKYDGQGIFFCEQSFLKKNGSRIVLYLCTALLTLIPWRPCDVELVRSIKDYASPLHKADVTFRLGYHL